MVVADTNLIAYFVIRDERSELADAIFEADPVWVAPLLWRSELRSALAKYIRHAGMSLEAALVALHSAEEVIGGREYRVSSELVLELAVRSKCTAYDCEYVALAQELGVPLVTADRQILRAFPKMAVALEKFTE
ncbi:MAG TPA: type II toxin-antitoxin system VapC family toxin [Verrucomicrobiae bacterium]